MRPKRRLEWTVDAIRLACTFEVSCQGTVPAALVAFLDADSYEDVVAMPYPTVATATPWPASPAASPRRFMRCPRRDPGGRLRRACRRLSGRSSRRSSADTDRGKSVPVPEKIISGGQTGVDRAALDVALTLGLAVGGWCPHGRRAEDGVIPERYPLMETPEQDYETRTRRNIEDADGTLIVNQGMLDGGTALTMAHAREIGKPCWVVALEEGIDPAAFRAWLEDNRIATLNVAGPRESKRPGVYEAAYYCLEVLLRDEAPE